MNATVEPTLRLRDNPLLVAQARRRLRRKQAAPTVAIAVVLGLCGVLFANVVGEADAWGGLVYTILFAMGAVVFIKGTAQMASTIVEERTSGILDFHRATPTTPWTDAVGFLIGVVAREYLVIAALFPFLVIAALMDGRDPLAPVLGMAVIVFSGALYHAFALVGGLIGGNKRGLTGMNTVIIVLLLVMAVPLYKAGFVTLAYLTPIPALASLLVDNPDLAMSVDFYGISLPPVIYTAIVQGWVLSFLVWGAARKMRREDSPPFSRRGAFVFFGIAVVLIVGGSWTSLAQGHAELASGPALAAMAVGSYLWGATGLASLLVVALVPSYLELVRAVRRARRAGRAAPSWLEDGASALPLVPAFGVLILAGYGLVAVAITRHVPGGVFGPEALLAIASAVAFVAFVTTAIEYARVTLRGSYRAGMLLIGFLSLVLPWLLMAIVAAATKEPDPALYTAALSPLYAVGASCVVLGMTWMADTIEIDSATIVVSLSVTVLASMWFTFRSRSIRSELTARIPLGGASPK